MTASLWGILAYAAGLIALGAWIGRRVDAAGSFFVADRKLGPVLLFATILAANLGAGTTVGAAGARLSRRTECVVVGRLRGHRHDPARGLGWPAHLAGRRAPWAPHHGRLPRTAVRPLGPAAHRRAAMVRHAHDRVRAAHRDGQDRLRRRRVPALGGRPHRRDRRHRLFQRGRPRGLRLGQPGAACRHPGRVRDRDPVGAGRHRRAGRRSRPPPRGHRRIT